MTHNQRSERMIKTTLVNLLAANQPQGEGKASTIGAFANCRGAKAMERLRTLDAIEAELVRFQRARNKIAEAHGKSLPIPETDPAFPEMVKEIQALLDAEVNLPGEPIKMSELGAISQELSPLDLRMLKSFWLVE